MKRILSTLFIFTVLATAAFAQRALMLKMNDGVTNAVATAEISEIKFSDDGATMSVTLTNGETVELNVAKIAEMSYGVMPTKLTVAYEENTATVVNPYLSTGVTASIKGADVTIDNTNETTEYTTELSGTTTNGSFTYNGIYKTTIVFAGVNITSQKGAAVDIECGKRVLLELKKGTVNTLVDAKGGKQKAALYCKGHLEIDKTGTLNVTGNTKHAMSAKEYIQLKKSDGKINIVSSMSDGIHCGQYFLGNGYTVNIDNVVGDGIQAELSNEDPYEEDYPNGSVTIQGGTYSINVTSDNVAGIKADGDVLFNSTKSPASVSIKATGAGSQGISTPGSVTIAEDGTKVDIITTL